LPETVLDEERADSNIEWLAGKVGEDLAELRATTWKCFPRLHFALTALQARAPRETNTGERCGLAPRSTTEPPIDFEDECEDEK
jgi:hypothetical protein